MPGPDRDQSFSAEGAVQRQLDAYNARDVKSFIAVYGEHVRIFRPPSIEPTIVGRAALAEFYATQRFNLPKLHAELLHRTVLRNKVVDHKRIAGVSERPFEVVVVYEVIGGKIRSVWFFSDPT